METESFVAQSTVHPDTITLPECFDIDIVHNLGSSPPPFSTDASSYFVMASSTASEDAHSSPPSQQAWIESLVQSQLSATAGPTSGAATAPISSDPITSYSPASSGTTGDEPAPAFTPSQQKWLEDFILSHTPPRPPAPGLIASTSSIPGMCVKLHKLH